jgi:tRNA uridine 5-carboxymethylaminomethyl modification enzyme
MLMLLGLAANSLRSQELEMDKWRRSQNTRIPVDILYTREAFPSFSGEEIEKLHRHRPQTFHEASQISGLTPQSLVYLYTHVTKRQRKYKAGATADTLAKIEPHAATGVQSDALLDLAG